MCRDCWGHISSRFRRVLNPLFSRHRELLSIWSSAASCLSAAPAALLVYICTCSRCVRSMGRAAFFCFVFCTGFTRRDNTVSHVVGVCLWHVYDFPVDGRRFVATLNSMWQPQLGVCVATLELCFIVNALDGTNVVI